MIWLQPRRVTIGGQELSHVGVVTVDRSADRVVVEHSDLGPHVAFADVPEQRVTIVLSRTLVNEGAAGSLRPGDSGTLSFRTAPSASDAQVREVTAEVVITAVKHEVSAKKGAMQTLECVAVSSDGTSDPISETVV
jgi:hypothetical protein